MNLRIRSYCEDFFYRLSLLFYRNPKKTIGFTGLFILVLTCFIPATRIDTSAVALLRETDPVRISYNGFRDQFNANDMIIISVTHESVYELSFLLKLKAFHDDLDVKVPYVKDITSLINARDTYSDGDELVVNELLNDWPEDDDDLQDLKERVQGNPLFENSLISNDGNVTCLIIETRGVITDQADDFEDADVLSGFEEVDVTETEDPDSDSLESVTYFSEKENRQVVRAVTKLAHKYHSPDFSISLAGDPVVLDVYNRAMERDIVMVVILSLITIGVFLIILFQRFSGLFLPELIVISALLSTFGLLSVTGVSVKLTTIVLPGFLLAVSVGYAVHILSVFFVSFQNGKSKQDAICYAMAHSGMAVLLTAVTTSASLFSFAFSELVSIADLGFFGASGVLLAFIFTLLLLPSMIAVLPIKRKHTDHVQKKSAFMDGILLSISGFSVRNPKKVVAGTVLLFFISTYYTTQIQYSHNVLNWINQDENIQKDVSYIDKTLKGSVILEVIADTFVDDGVKHPEFLKSLELIFNKLSLYQKNGISVGKVMSITDLIKEINQSMHDNNPDYYVLPDSKEMIYQELLLFENTGSDDLESMVDESYTKTRIGIKIPWTDAVYLKDFMDYTHSLFYNEFGNRVSVTITGIPALLSRTIPTALNSMSKSYVIAFCIITLLMIVHVGNIKIGLLSMISNLLPILMTMGIMGAFQIKLDMSTIMIGSIAIGIVVDDTLHFMYNFRKFYEKTGNPIKAIQKTMLGTGRALLLTSLILSTGFFILMTASLSLLVIFGALTGLTILFALLADFIINPALMILVTRKSVS